MLRRTVNQSLFTSFLILAIWLGLAGRPSIIGAQARSCPGAPPLRMAVGMRGQVTPTPAGQHPSPLRVRLAPGSRGKILGQLHDGDLFNVIDGPICTENLAWWKLHADNGLEGWAAEGDATGYFIEPFGTQSTSPAPTGAPTTIGPSPVPVRTPTIAPTATLPPLKPVSPDDGAKFAAFAPGNVDATGQVTPYQIAPDFSNVLLSAALTRNQLDFLQRSGFVVSPGSALEFSNVYNTARQNLQPLFIT